MEVRQVGSEPIVGKSCNCHVGPLTGSDGTCTRTGFKCLDRAAWAVGGFSVVGELEVVVQGPVVFPLPQTPQAAEHLGFLVLQQILAEQSNAYVDCKSVLDSFHKPLAARLSYKSM